MEYKYNIESVNMGESSRYEPRFSVAELTTFGNTLEELIENAGYSWIDQDGGEIDSGIADDDEAVEYITNWFKENGKPEVLENPDRKYDEFKERC
jgi:hypothetical protein